MLASSRVVLQAAADSARSRKCLMGLGLGEKPLVPAVYHHKRGYHSYSAERLWHYRHFE